jgi:TonB family protein
MLGLNKKETKFFMGSLFGHAVLIGVLGVLGFLPSCEEKEKEVHVFELASASYAPPSPPVVKPIVTPPLRDTPPPPPTPAKTQVKPVVQPEPVLPKPKKIVPKPTPKTAPKPKPKPRAIVPPKTVSFDQFKKKHNLPTPQTAPKTNNRVPRVKINPKNFTLPKIVVSSTIQQSSTVDPSLLNQYLGEVKAKLEAVWKRLQQSSPIVSGGEVFLSFKISSNGTLVSPTISRSSGNAALDRLVMQVSKSVGNLGRPPGGKLSSSLEIPFRIR